jgi:hypothetical protein
MRKLFLLVACGILLVTGCNKSVSPDENLQDDESPIATQRKCGAQEVLEEQMKADPSLRQRMDEIEAFTRRVAAHPDAYRLLPNGIIEIPVVINVLYKKNVQNISLAQIQSQIDALNLDYSAANSDYSSTPSDFLSFRSGDIGIRFVLDATNRKKTNKQSWQLNDAMKKSNQGGIDPTSPATKLNMWVCNLASGYLGYAQFPGGNPATDGVVIDDNAFGTTGTAVAPFNKGRTATHEIGHWMNLRHIWGDQTCGSDQVDDTPPHHIYNFGCPGVLNITCLNNSTTNPYGFTREMTMNYMDYTDDACMFIFSGGQKTRMLAVFASGGPRNSFTQQ